MIAQDGSISDKSKLVENEASADANHPDQRSSDVMSSDVTSSTGVGSVTSVGFISSHLSAASIASSTESSAGMVNIQSFIDCFKLYFKFQYLEQTLFSVFKLVLHS